MRNRYRRDPESPPLSRAFTERRIHSLMGLSIVLFLFEHLLTNSQAALFVGDDGKGFIHSVNFIHSLPYLPFIEISLLAVPILTHIFLNFYVLKKDVLSWLTARST